MNLKKFTKAELISKINGIKSKNNDSNPTLFSSLMNFLLVFKTFLLKFTLIALIIRVFKKYSIFRKLWTFFSFTLYSIFGISLIDIYEIEILSKFINNILDFYSKFHESILDLFGKKVEVPIETPTKMGSMNRIDQSSTTSKESNKIIERFNQIIHKEPIEVKETIEIPEENNPLYKNKYVIIGGILVLSCLTWYFHDDIKPIASSLWTWLHSFRPRPSDNADGSNSSLPRSSKTILQSLKDKIYKKIYGADAGPEPFFDTPSSRGKSIDLRNLSQAEIDRRRLLELHQFEIDRQRVLEQDLTGLRHITGNSFTAESDAVLSEINTFLNRYDTKTLATPTLTLGLYNLLRERLLKLSESSVRQYDQLTENRVVNAKIERFLDLETEICESPEVNANARPSQEVNATPSPGLNNYAYDDIAEATDLERDAWSDYARTPSNRSQLLSPVNIGEPLTDNSDGSSPYRFQVQTLPTPPMPISEMQDRLPYRQLTPPSDLDHYFPPSQYAQEQIRNNENAQPIEAVSNPNIVVNPEVAESQPEATGTSTENRTGLGALWDQIRNRRNDRDVVSTPNIPEVEIQTTEVQPVASETQKSLFEQIRSRGKGKNVVNTQPEASGSSTQPEATGSSTVVQNKPKLDSLWDSIKARRNERDVVASPNISNVGLQTPIQERLNTSPIAHKSSFTNLFEDTMNLFDDEPIDTGIDTSGSSSSNVEIPNNSSNLAPLIDSLDKVKVVIDKKDHKLNFNFGGMEDQIKSIHTATNDGYTATFDYKGANSYSWDNRIDNSKYSQGANIQDIFITDKNGKVYNIYHNDPIIA